MAIAMKTCRDCGAQNDANDLFCKECGSSLAMVATNDETAAFRPIPSTGQTGVIPSVAASPSTQQAVSPSYPVYTGAYDREPESARGAVLGWIAVVIMLLIVGFFLWSSVITESTRDSLTGWF